MMDDIKIVKAKDAKRAVLVNWTITSVLMAGDRAFALMAKDQEGKKFSIELDPKVKGAFLINQVDKLDN